MALRPLERWRQAWRGDEWRKEVNRHSVRSDIAGLTFAAFLTAAFIYFKTHARDGDTGPACVVALQVGLHLALAALAAGRPAWYAAHRELIHTANLLCHNLAIRQLVTHGTYDYFSQEHRGSPLRLLLCFLCPWGNWPWAAAGALFLRLSVRWNAAALPLATLLPLLSGRSVCHRLLAADPTFARPFERAFAALDTLFGAAGFPTGQVLLQGPGATMDRCLVLDYWLALVVSIAVPLLLIAPVERRDRQRYAEAQQRRAAEAALAAGVWPQLCPDPQGAPSEQAGGSWRLLDLYLGSTLLWQACIASVLAWRRLR